MITEMAILTALPDSGDALGRAIAEGIEFIRQDPGCESIQVTRGIEQPDRFVVSVGWTSLAAHVEHFRSTPQFGRWLGSISGLFDSKTLDTQHYVGHPADE